MLFVACPPLFPVVDVFLYKKFVLLRNNPYLCDINDNKHRLFVGKFLNPFSDVGFKRIFGQEMSKPLLLDFLNNLLRASVTSRIFAFLTRSSFP